MTQNAVTQILTTVVPSCTLPDPPGHALIVSQQGQQGLFKTGEVVQYQCEENFYLESGTLIRNCTHSGTWTGLEPVCKEARVLSAVEISGILVAAVVLLVMLTLPIDFYFYHKRKKRSQLSTSRMIKDQQRPRPRPFQKGFGFSQTNKTVIISTQKEMENLFIKAQTRNSFPPIQTNGILAQQSLNELTVQEYSTLTKAKTQKSSKRKLKKRQKRVKRPQIEPAGESDLLEPVCSKEEVPTSAEHSHDIGIQNGKVHTNSVNETNGAVTSRVDTTFCQSHTLTREEQIVYSIPGGGMRPLPAPPMDALRCLEAKGQVFASVDDLYFNKFV